VNAARTAVATKIKALAELGLSGAAIAERMGLSPSHVGLKLRRAGVSLRGIQRERNRRPSEISLPSPCDDDDAPDTKPIE
jgi:hypothetical protein